ncbi:hypothetical protein PPL_00229 [Heterostelium album PN500]|uniref:[Phosphatase 2A protein]-leucine-carboxy methyltransferase 1 n=1 Tax=Heterostelium pallidum (strain ATCC 26659 / Pp 5 / PN500) TaxID=670386 RepID=D3AVW4_HETP5|nr:hypothetical protein PPL_00229 [Heterostelium album PN500]EFA86437.1 hypothetical protein PPL_00229 [Heterostelium album PN500]|eukprot:XP_020438542.1 hypothetical protein PPL_00229 [Heterostelium album PN500]
MENTPSITGGVARTSVLIAGGRTLVTNSFINEQLKISEKLEESFIPYYENVYKKEPFYSEIINDKVASFDPYAYFFCCTKESVQILMEQSEQFLNMIPTQFARNQLAKYVFSKKGLEFTTIEDAKRYCIENYTPVQCFGLMYLDSFNVRFALRNKFIDHIFMMHIKDQTIQQYVILGAGLDTRALRMPFGKESTVWEIDFAQTFQYKEMILNEAIKVIPPISKAKLHRVTSNVLESKQWISSLEETGFDKTKPTAWLLEGLVMYLTEKDIEMLCQEVSLTSASGSSMVIQATGKRGFMGRVMSSFLPTPLRNEYKSASDRPCDYITNCGFTNNVENNTETDLCKRYDFDYVRSFMSMDTDSIIAIGYKPYIVLVSAETNDDTCYKNYELTFIPKDHQYPVGYLVGTACRTQALTIQRIDVYNFKGVPNISQNMNYINKRIELERIVVDYPGGYFTDTNIELRIVHNPQTNAYVANVFYPVSA